MKFQVGHKLSKGRPKGSMSKRSERAIEILRECNFCPVETLVKIVKEANEQYEHYKDKEHSGRISPMEDNAAKYLKIMADSTKDLAGYVYPKLKAIEQTRPNPLADLSPEERLLAMKQAVMLLEAQMGKPSGSGAT